MVLLYILAATIIVSLLSLLGVLTLKASDKTMRKLMFFFVSFAAGTMLGAAFLDLLPEALGRAKTGLVMASALGGIMLFFIFEKIIHWHHHYNVKDKGKKPKPLGYLTLWGDAFHNLFDGFAIAAGFLAGTDIGIATTVAVILHEIPHEIGDYTLLIYSGFGRMKALLFNLFSGVTSILGALVFFYFAGTLENMIPIMLGLTAGNFIYTASADLVPEIHKETEPGKSAQQIIFLLMGMGIIGILTILLGV